MWLQSTADISTALSSTTAYVRPSRAAPTTREYQSDDSDLHVHVLLKLHVHYIVFFDKCALHGCFPWDLLCAYVISFLNTGFGSALNIETLVAAAEQRETLIQVY